VDASPDRGKEAKVSLDWTDPERLKELLRLRLVYNGLERDTKFNVIWPSICTSHIEGEESSEYLLKRSLMRPRNYLTLVNHCKSNAVNFGHEKILEKDIEKACESYSSDLLNEIGYEIRDVYPQAEDILYHFIGKPSIMSFKDVRDCLTEYSFPIDEIDKLIEILLWFGFLGVRRQLEHEISETYIYNVFYDMKKLKRLAGDLKDENLMLCIHCAFWPFLEIEEGVCAL
jgi:hypothetical protein